MLQVLIIKTIANPLWERRWLWAFYLALWVPSWLLPGTFISALDFFVLISLAAFVIPHGVADFYLPAWILNPPWTRRLGYWGVVTTIFSIFTFFTYVVFQISINFSIALFSAIIMWHWGSLDTIYIYSHRGLSWVVGSIGRGMLVLVAPLFFRPLETQELILSLTGANESFILSTLYSFSEYLLILAILLEFLAALLHKFIEGRGLPHSFSAHAAESIVILLTFAFVHPILGLTFYFLILHSFRHISRVPAYIPEARGSLIEGRGNFRNLSYYFQKTFLFSVVAVLILTAWFAWNFYSGMDLVQATAASIRPLLLLLIPHTLVSLLADFNPKQIDG